jgi:Saxitoxin biosynthesis operon protein SxtJ
MGLDVATHEDFSRIHQIKTSSNRAFGWVFTAVFMIVGLWPLISGHAPRTWSLILGAVMVLITLVAPALLATPNRLWLRFGLLLNRIVSPIVLGFIFFVVVTPMGALMRLLGKDTLRLRSGHNDASYWVKREPPGPRPDSLNDQF